ncbi:MAG: electron transporter RnfD [Spirochaeta sp. LUC14_002_19_P3]|nr:MAG: electron transporter RnfD [Spirochaeta sp. LUC14_002_19_P3]
MKLTISTSPHIHGGGSTRSVMAWVLIALLPAGVWSVIMFGLRAAVVIAAATAAAVCTEYLLNRIFKKSFTLGDLSAAVTGVLIGYNMPPQVPLFIPIAASVFAIAVVKWSFGGLGANWMNPALAGRVFVFFSWGAGMTQWTLPRFGSAADAVSAATALGGVKTALTNLPPSVHGPMELLAGSGMPVSYMDLFLGRVPGSLGEISALLLILGGLLLCVLRIANWEIPVFYIASFALLIWIFDGYSYGGGMFSGDVLFHLLSGGLMLGAWFMATDLVTSPLLRGGRIIFGIGCGLMTFVIRVFGSLPEGVSLAIIFMNILTPLIDRYMTPKRYGKHK